MISMQLSRKKEILSVIIALMFCCVLAACSNSRHLPAGESLFKGSQVHINDHEASQKERKVLITDLTGAVRPKTNTKTLGARVKLSLYNFAGDTKRKKGLRPWLRNRVGEPPVLVSSVHLNNNRDIMVNLLQNRGFFHATVAAKMNTNKKKKSTAVFDVTTGPQYVINQVFFRKDSSAISNDIESAFSKTLLTPGSPYNLDLIKAERTRIDRNLKELGYFYFKPDYILVIVDSSIGGNKVNMYVKLKHREIPPEVYNVYSINDIYIYANYNMRGRSEDTSKTNAVVVDSYQVIDNKKMFRPVIFSQAMDFDKGEKYSLDPQNISLSRLVNMGVFKFVKNRFEPVGDSLLDVYYYLTSYPKKSLRFELGALTQNDNRAGSEASISWRNRNAFKGAEQLLFKIHGGYEAQYSGPVKQPDIYNLGAEMNLSFPRFLVPFFNVQSASRYLPRSVIKLKYNYESESRLLRISSYTASYGYAWKEGLHKEHQLYPFNFTYVKTDTLGNTENLNLLYGNLIFDGIILGPTYEFTYNSQNGPLRTHSIYFDGLIDLSGNILGLAQRADIKNNPQEILGATYAQYIKLQPDFRYYLRLSALSTIAARVMAGVGIPYGNSAQLPNVKQFWAGGNSDLRGFPSRLVGPGTFNEYSIYNTNKYLATLGDLKMEANLELRQKVYRFINAALFFDMGNIWLYNKNEAFPGGTFTSDFYREFAADIGVGLRFDFKILILRLDLGMPVHKPWVSENNGWVIDKIDFSSSAWRRNNMVLNIAIGYPF